MTIKISDQFDAGAIEVVRADAAQAIELNLRPDSHADLSASGFISACKARAARLAEYGF